MLINIIILLLVIIIILLIILCFYIMKKTTYLSKKEKEFIEFAIDMYIDYSEELKITSPEDHELIIKNLEKIKKEKISYET